MNDDQKVRWRKITADQLDGSLKEAAERTRAQLALSQDALKALLLANGGAMIALFTFVGNVLSKAPAVRFDLGNLRIAFALFVLGFVLDLIAYVMAFLSQDRAYIQGMAEAGRLTAALLGDERVTDRTPELVANRQHRRFYFSGIGLAVLSVLSFAVGCGFALGGVMI